MRGSKSAEKEIVQAPWWWSVIVRCCHWLINVGSHCLITSPLSLPCIVMQYLYSIKKESRKKSEVLRVKKKILSLGIKSRWLGLLWLDQIWFGNLVGQVFIGPDSTPSSNQCNYPFLLASKAESPCHDGRRRTFPINSIFPSIIQKPFLAPSTNFRSNL